MSIKFNKFNLLYSSGFLNIKFYFENVTFTLFIIIKKYLSKNVYQLMEENKHWVLVTELGYTKLFQSISP